jgi:hypothetical protein
MRIRPRPTPLSRSAFAGFRFPPDVIVLAVRWYLRFGLSYRDVEELLTERGIKVDHFTVYRWVQRFTPLLAEAARPCRHTVGDRWCVDEAYVKVGGSGATPTGRSTSSGRSLTSSSRRAAMSRQPPVLPAGHRHHQGHAGRGRHRPGSDLSGRAGGATAGGLASH